MAKEMGIALTVGSDAHAKGELKDIQYGVYQARRGWLTMEDVLNASSLINLNFKKNG